MDFLDRLQIDDAAKVRKTGEGYLAAVPRVARIGLQTYSGKEVGKPEMDRVVVLRPESAVFDGDSINTFFHRPVTDGHPSEPVTAKNWKDHAVGLIGGKVVRDGEFVRAEMVIYDGDMIDAIEGGKAELSVGYSADLEFKAGETDGGLKYDAIQTNIRVNHLAVVNAARGGKQLRIGDQKAMRKIVVDGITYDAEDQIGSVIEKLVKDRDTAQGALAAKDATIGELTAKVSTKDGEIAVLKDAAEKNKITPQMIDEAVAKKMAVATQAKRIMGDAFVTDGKEPDAIRAEVVNAKLGDAAKGFGPDAINGAFATLLASAGTTTNDQNGNPDPVAAALRDGAGGSAVDKAWQDSINRDRDAWKGEAKH